MGLISEVWLGGSGHKILTELQTHRAHKQTRILLPTGGESLFITAQKIGLRGGKNLLTLVPIEDFDSLNRLGFCF